MSDGQAYENMSDGQMYENMSDRQMYENMSDGQIVSRLHYLIDYVQHAKLDETEINRLREDISRLKVAVENIIDRKLRKDMQIELMNKKRFLQWLIDKCNELPEKYHPGRIKQWWKLGTNPLKDIDCLLEISLQRGDGSGKQKISAISIEESKSRMKCIEDKISIVADMVIDAQIKAGVSLTLNNEVDLRLYNQKKQKDLNYQIKLEDYKNYTLYQKWMQLK